MPRLIEANSGATCIKAQEQGQQLPLSA